jgi:hypothetical protein
VTLAAFEVPLTGMPQRFATALGGITYILNFQWRNNPLAGWVLDIADAGGNPLVAGIPLVTGCDLLAQYAYLGFTGGLVVFSDGDLMSVPTFTNLGALSHVFWLFDVP